MYSQQNIVCSEPLKMMIASQNWQISNFCTVNQKLHCVFNRARESLLCFNFKITASHPYKIKSTVFVLIHLSYIYCFFRGLLVKFKMITQNVLHGSKRFQAHIMGFVFQHHAWLYNRRIILHKKIIQQPIAIASPSKLHEMRLYNE